MLLLLASCGLDEGTFLTDYTEARCQLAVDCGAGPEATFQGIDTLEECLAVDGPTLVAQGEGCEYRAKRAASCLKDLEVVGCPPLGEPVESVLPVACFEVYVDCGPSSGPADTGA